MVGGNGPPLSCGEREGMDGGRVGCRWGVLGRYDPPLSFEERKGVPREGEGWMGHMFGVGGSWRPSTLVWREGGGAGRGWGHA